MDIKIQIKKGYIFMKKILITSVLALSIFSSLGTTAFAQSTNNTDSVDVITNNLTDGISKASWGEGILTSKNPWGGKPWGYATTKTFAGNAHTLEAQTFVNNNGISTDSTANAIKNNTNSVQSSTLTAKTESCTFRSKHWLKDTSTSGWQSAENERSY